MNIYIKQNTIQANEKSANENRSDQKLNGQNNNDSGNDTTTRNQSNIQNHNIEDNKRIEENKKEEVIIYDYKDCNQMKESNNNDSENMNPFVNIKFSQNGQYKRVLDFYSSNNTLQQYLKKLKTCCMNHEEVRTFREKRFPLGCDKTTTIPLIPEDETKGLSYDSNSSSSNHDNMLYHKRKINHLNRNKNKTKNRSRKRKRLVAKIDKIFMLKCRTCKYINPNGLKIEDYYVCQNCGDKDFSVMIPNPSNNINTNMESPN